MAAAPRGGNKRKDGNMSGAGANRGRGAWGRGAPHMNQGYAPNMTPNMHLNQRPLGPGPNGHPNFPGPSQIGGAPMGPSQVMKSNQDRMLFLMSSQIGSRINVNLTNGQRFEGLLVMYKTDSVFTLEDAKDRSAPTAPIRPKLQIQTRDLAGWELVEGAQQPAPSSSFRTDADIASQQAPAVRERDLAGPGAWANDSSQGIGPLPSFQPASTPSIPSFSPPPAVNGKQHGDDLTFGAGSSGGWDQFAANEKLFGVKTSFDEDLYTTKLDRTASDFKERERKAQKLADEIQGISSSNPHLAEERGVTVDDSGINEEDKYGAVVRGPNVYIPPGARRAGANGTPSQASRVTSPQPTTPTAGPIPTIAVNPATTAIQTVTSPPTTIQTVPISPTTPTVTSVPTAPIIPTVPVLPAVPTVALATPAATPPISPAVTTIPTVSINAPVEDAVPEAGPASKVADGKISVKTDVTDAKPDGSLTSAAPTTSTAVSPTASPATSTLGASTSSDKASRTGDKAPPADVDSGLVNDFRAFVTSEKERLTTTRKTVLKLEKDKRIADLIRFSSTFKLNKEVPEDLVDIMTKDDKKRKAIVEKSKEDAKSTVARAIGVSPTALPPSTSNRFAPSIGLAQAANAVKNPVANAIPTSAAASNSAASAAAKLAAKASMADKYPISIIPPFNPNKGRATATASTSPVSMRQSASVSSAGKPAEMEASTSAQAQNQTDFKLNINASSFKPNVNAQSFKPVNGATPAPKASTSKVAKPVEEPPAVVPVQNNPFFGTANLKKGSVHIKDEFSPFRHNKVAEATTVVSTWPYSGKKYMTMFPVQPVPPPPAPMPTAYEEETQAQHVAQAQVYMTSMYGYPQYRYPGQPVPQPGHAPMPIQGNPNGYMPQPQFMPMHYPPPMHGGPPPMYTHHPMMSPMPPPGTPYMQPPGPPPGQYPGPPNGNGMGRGTMPPTPMPPHAYAYHQSPQMGHAVPYQMMMPPPGAPNGPPMQFDGNGPPHPMGPPR